MLHPAVLVGKGSTKRRSEATTLMQPVNVYEFVDFGIGVQALRWFGHHFEGETRRSFAKYRANELGVFRDKWLVPRDVGIDLINSAISELEYAVTSEELDEMRAKIDPAPKAPHEVNWDAIVRRVGTVINELMTVLEHEFPKFPILSVEALRAFDTTVLLNSAERALSASSQKRLSSHWLEGWREAGRCLAFEAPTAATFQILRVTEGVIKKYRKVVTGSDGTDADGLSDHINALKTACVSETVITALRSLKNAHRNPTMHPGKNATIDEAVGLFGICTSVIDFISSDMDSRERVGGVVPSAP